MSCVGTRTQVFFKKRRSKKNALRAFRDKIEKNKEEPLFIAIFAEVGTKAEQTENTRAIIMSKWVLERLIKFLTSNKAL